MKIFCLLLLLLIPFGGLRADKDLGYPDYLQSAANAIYDEDYSSADEYFEKAFRIATTDTEKALALAKRAHMMAYKQKKYSEAIKQIEFARRFKDRKPVAEITLFQTEAECLMKDGEKYSEAAEVLEEAVKLKGVDWALPGSYLKMGDCYRFSGEPVKALKAYEQVLTLEKVSEKAKSVAYLNMGITQQYNLRNPSKAREAYRQALVLDEGLESQIAIHLEKL